MSCECCIPLDCGVAEDLVLYSLESDPFPFVLTCPPGYNCNALPPAGGTDVPLHMVCCGVELTGVIPAGSTQAQASAVISDLVSRCATMQFYCGELRKLPPGGGPGGDGPLPPAGPPLTLYWNAPGSCTKKCPDGTPFTYRVKAGIVLGQTAGQANAIAGQIACSDAVFHMICLGSLPDACTGADYSKYLTATGAYFAVYPQTDFWEVISGTLPPGLTFHGGALTWFGKSGSGSQALLDGTPTTAGNYTFTVRVTAPNGDYQQKEFTIVIAGLGPAMLADATIFSSYSQNLSFDPSHDQDTELWSIISGSLPPGLEFTDAGIIHGIATGPLAGYQFGIQASALFPSSSARIQCEKVFTIETVSGVCTIATATPLPNATKGDPYSTALTSNGSAPCNWTIVSGALPTGLSLGLASGIISGTPSVSGDFTFGAHCAAGNAACDKSFSLHVVNAANCAELPGTVHCTDLIAPYNDQCVAIGCNPWDGSLQNIFPCQWLATPCGATCAMSVSGSAGNWGVQIAEGAAFANYLSSQQSPLGTYTLDGHNWGGPLPATVTVS